MTFAPVWLTVPSLRSSVRQVALFNVLPWLVWIRPHRGQPGRALRYTGCHRVRPRI